MYECSIPRCLQTDRNGYEFLAGLYPDITSQSDKEVVIDFLACLKIDGNLAAALGAILDKLVDDGYAVMLRAPHEKRVRRILSRNHFLRMWSIETNVEERENFVKYRRFRSNDSSDFKKYIDEELIHKQKFPKHTELVGKNIVENVFEVYANAIMHGSTDYVYSCGEYKESDQVLEMTIVDCGMTIPKNVNTYLAERDKQILSSCDAIEWAFISGNTTKSQTGGLGLALLKEFINLNEGAIQVISGEGMIEYREGKVEQNLLSIEFPGTIVNMKFNFKDSKRYYMVSEESGVNLDDLL